LKQDPQALQTLSGMPPSSYGAAMRDPGFQATVASIYQGQNRLDAAQQILEKSVSAQVSAGQKPSTAVLLQLAGIYLTRNNPQRAFPIYRQVLSENADRPDAWKGLLTVLHSSGRNQEALAQVQQIPQPVRVQLESDVEYLQTVGAVYNSLGRRARRWSSSIASSSITRYNTLQRPQTLTCRMPGCSSTAAMMRGFIVSSCCLAVGRISPTSSAALYRRSGPTGLSVVRTGGRSRKYQALAGHPQRSSEVLPG
jgi:hypothetical protein